MTEKYKPKKWIKTCQLITRISKMTFQSEKEKINFKCEISVSTSQKVTDTVLPNREI